MRTAPVEAPLQKLSLPRWVPLLFLLASFLVSIAFLAVRNIYDDEIGTTDLLPVPAHLIVAQMNHADVHPPGMYVLAHLGYQVIPSARWVTLFPLVCLYLGLTVYVLAYAPLFRTRAASVCFLLFATFHPQLLMWGNSIRWYPWWSGLALVTVVVALNPRAGATAHFGTFRAFALGVLLGCLFYFNYITILFATAITVGLAVRYGLRIWRQYLLTCTIALLLVLPQLHAFLTVHLRGSSGQRSNPLLSVARLVQSIFSSEAYLPWHPLAVVAALLFAAVSVIGIAAAVRTLRRHGQAALRERKGGLTSSVVFSLVFFLLVAASGLGGKPRNGLTLVPLLAPSVALVVGGLRSRYLQGGVLGFILLWSGVGIAHLLRREGLTKSGMNNRPEEVLRFIETSRGTHCSVVVTYDPILSFYLAQSRLANQLILTASQNTLYRDVGRFTAERCGVVNLYVVRSYLGGFGRFESVLPAQLAVAASFIQPPVQIHAFSHDPDAGLKRRLRFVGGTASLPDDRYVVESGEMASAAVTKLEEMLPYFTIADGQSRPRLR